MFTVFLLRKPDGKVYKLGKPIENKDQEIEDRAKKDKARNTR